MVGIALLVQVSRWYATHHAAHAARAAKRPAVSPLPRNRVIGAIAVLLLLIFSKYFYIASISSFYTFYLIDKFGLSVSSAQFHLFIFLLAAALGTLVGGPVGDRIGRKPVIWVSILGVAPVRAAAAACRPVLDHDADHRDRPHPVVGVLGDPGVCAGADSGKVGMVSGLFFGFAFGMGGLGAAVLGLLADHTSIDFVYRVCAFLPLLGVVAVLLPSIERRRT